MRNPSTSTPSPQLEISRREVPGRSGNSRTSNRHQGARTNNAEAKKSTTDWLEYTPARPSAAPFCTADTARAWLRAHPEAKPMICNLRRKDQLVGLLPLYRFGKSKTLRAVADTDLDYQDILADSEEDSNQLAAQLVDFCATSNYQLSFQKVAENSRLHNALNSPEVRERAWIRSRYYSSCPVTDFSGLDKREFRACLSKNKKEAYRKATKRIRNAFPEAEVEQLRASEITGNHVSEIGELHRANQHRKSGNSIFGRPEFLEFIRQQTQSRSSMRLSILRESPNGNIMAFALGYFDNDTYYYYIPSYEGAYHHLSPGAFLLKQCLSHFSTEIDGDTLYFDMLSGTESYKKRWARSRYEVLRIQVIPKKWSNLPRLLAYSVIYGLKAWKNRVRKIA